MKAISLGNRAFEGLNNAYLLEGEVTTLVDTGIATPDTEQGLRDGLADAGYEFTDVDQLLLTHFHADHVGLAGAVQEESDAVVRVHEADAPLVAQDADARTAMEERQRAALDRWGMPEDAQSELLGVLDGSDGIEGSAPEVTPFESGEAFAAGDRTLEAVHLPGHSAGLCGFACASDYVGLSGSGRDLFSGDALLPYYTPNVGGADVRVERPLAEYLDTLTRIAEGGYARAWPGHRGPIVDPTGRARDIAVHHRERTGRVLAALRDHGPADAWTVSARLFGGLSSIHILHGPGEASAHLDHLAEGGLLTVTETSSREYELTDAADDESAVDDLFPALAVE
ncbi:MBL fold metallo-hydrolase [Halomarina oriensis]|uniref:MBL fold metallo-hydrolase n=1 Tax=Halomarina oriensis TaxID=671145 RepID=A0A6B0GWL8_9EURY|nr:MBL fold metallo-hydrolase [Halomarina oriensis]MWG36138.1 MBL fold metallo-hydrolase [Halomarina oriensis]